MRSANCRVTDKFCNFIETLLSRSRRTGDRVYYKRGDGTVKLWRRHAKLLADFVEPSADGSILILDRNAIAKILAIAKDARNEAAREAVKHIPSADDDPMFA